MIAEVVRESSPLNRPATPSPFSAPESQAKIRKITARPQKYVTIFFITTPFYQHERLPSANTY
jgi:hypothetical protein